MGKRQCGILGYKNHHLMGIFMIFYGICNRKMGPQLPSYGHLYVGQSRQVLGFMGASHCRVFWQPSASVFVIIRAYPFGIYIYIYSDWDISLYIYIHIYIYMPGGPKMGVPHIVQNWTILVLRNLWFWGAPILRNLYIHLHIYI